MSRKTLIALLATIAVLVAGVFLVAAQDDDDDSPLPFGPGWMHQWDNDGPGTMRGYGMRGGRGWMHGEGGNYGPGMMRGGPHMMWGEEVTMMDAAAEALGLEAEAFYDALREGQPLADLAEAQGVSLDTVHEAMLAQMEAHLAEQVEAGWFTQDEADDHLAWMQDNINSMPMFGGRGFGPCGGPGMMGGRGPGR